MNGGPKAMRPLADRIAIALGVVCVSATLAYWPLVLIFRGSPATAHAALLVERIFYVGLPGALLGTLTYRLWTRRNPGAKTPRGWVGAAIGTATGVRILAEVLGRSIAVIRSKEPAPEHDLGPLYLVAMFLEFLYLVCYCVLLVVVAHLLIARTRRISQPVAR